MLGILQTSVAVFSEVKENRGAARKSVGTARSLKWDATADDERSAAGEDFSSSVNVGLPSLPVKPTIRDRKVKPLFAGDPCPSLQI